MLGYRSFFSVRSNGLADSVRAQMYSWLRSKDYAADQLEYGVEKTLAIGVTGIVFRLDRPDGTKNLRYRIAERTATGIWTTRLTVQLPRTIGELAWVWLDVDATDEDSGEPRKGRWFGTPRLARGILEVTEAFDGLSRLEPRPRIVHSDELDEVIDVICDPDRRAPAFVAGTDQHRPLAPWVEQVADLLRDTVGLAGSYVLDAVATQALAGKFGESHAVSPGSIRSFMPAADPACTDDGFRHRMLTARRIEQEDAGRLRRFFGWRAREAALDLPLSRSVVRLDRELAAYEDQLLLRRLTKSAPQSVTAELASSAPTVNESTNELVQETELSLALTSAAQSVLGSEEVDVAAVEELARLAILGQRLQDVQASVSTRLAELQGRANALEDERDELRKRLEDEELEHAVAANELHSAAATARYLRGQLAELGTPIWTEALQHDPKPEDFGDLLSWLPGLEFVRFTGDPEIVRNLEKHDPWGICAGKAWDACRALDDYARCKRLGTFAGSVHEYLTNTPPGYCGYSVNRFGAGESEEVRNNRRYRDARMFPVPSTVEQSGRAFMEAHFKIVQRGLISPRMHYLDDTGKTSLVYIGYLGPHLPTGRTN